MNWYWLSIFFDFGILVQDTINAWTKKRSMRINTLSKKDKWICVTKMLEHFSLLFFNIIKIINGLLRKRMLIYFPPFLLKLHALTQKLFSLRFQFTFSNSKDSRFNGRLLFFLFVCSTNLFPDHHFIEIKKSCDNVFLGDFPGKPYFQLFRMDAYILHLS